MWASASVIAELQEEIRSTETLRYAHRLHGVLLVAQGQSYAAAAQVLGESPRTIKYWVRRYLDHGKAGLRERKRLGRPRVLTPEQLEEINTAVRDAPDGPLKTGKGLAGWIDEHYSVRVSVRWCQYLLRSLREGSKRDASSAASPRRRQRE